MTRILTALVGIPLLIYAIKFAPAIVCTVLIFIAMILALNEYFSLIRIERKFFFLPAGFILASLILFSFYFDWPYSDLFGLIPLILLTLALFSRSALEVALHDAVFSLFGIWYVGGLMGYLVGVRMIDGGSEFGADLLMMLFIIIWVDDTFAFFAGKKFGKRKIAPTVSPKKTVEGSIAGFIFSIIAAVICSYTFVKQLPVVHAACIGAIVGLIGQIGDLCESIIKRAVNVKDSGGIIPGHGGMLDRVDSLLFGAPAMYYYVYFFRLS